MGKITVVVKNINSEYIDKHYDELLSGLYEQRRTAIEQLKNKKAAYASIVAGYLLIEAVTSVYDISKDAICIKKTEFGKPYIDSLEEFKYNISHSGDYVAIAYGDDDIGIDVEQLREKDIKIAKRCFHSDEVDYILRDDEGQDERFFKIWTGKEAYLKYTGQGINVPLNSFVVDVENATIRDKNVALTMKRIDDLLVTICAKDTGNIEYKQG